MMCLHACEKSDVIMFARNYTSAMELERGTILHNLDRIKEFLSLSDVPRNEENESVRETFIAKTIGQVSCKILFYFDICTNHESFFICDLGELFPHGTAG